MTGRWPATWYSVYIQVQSRWWAIRAQRRAGDSLENLRASASLSLTSQPQCPHTHTHTLHLTSIFMFIYMYIYMPQCLACRFHTGFPQQSCRLYIDYAVYATSIDRFHVPMTQNYCLRLGI